MVVEFIKIKHSLNEALAYRASGQEDRSTYEFGGVQLLPNNEFPYVQRTHDPAGIEIEDFHVWVCDTCGNEIQEITAYFNVTRIFQDLNGKPQIEWELRNVPFDFAYNLVLLKIQQGANEFFYTTPFYLTNDGSELTSRWDYQQDFNDTMLSCQLQVYFRDYDSALNLASYNRVADGKRRVQNIQNTEFERWKTQNVDKTFFKEFRNIFLSRVIYADLALAGLYDAFETPEIEFDQNFLESGFNITRDESQLYDPNYVAPPTPPEPPVESEIVLNNVQSINSSQVVLFFELVNLDSSVLQPEYSQDGITWQSNQITGSDSPITMTAPNNTTENYYYRIKDVATGITSNVFQFLNPALVINNISAEPAHHISSGNNYYIDWNSIGYTPSAYLTFEGSRNLGVGWTNMLYAQGNENPKTVKAPASSPFVPRFKYFRVRDESNGLISNVYEHEF